MVTPIFQSAFQNARTHLKISSSELASRLGVKKPFISRIENRKQKASLALILKLEALTGFSFWALVAGDFKAENQHNYTTISALNYDTLQVDLKQLNTADRRYLKNKLLVEVETLTKELKSSQEQLTESSIQANHKQEELIQLEQKVQTTKRHLTFLERNNAPAEFITEQKEKLEAEQSTLAYKQQKGATLSKRAIVLAQLEIETIERKITLWQNEFTQL